MRALLLLAAFYASALVAEARPTLNPERLLHRYCASVGALAGTAAKGRDRGIDRLTVESQLLTLDIVKGSNILPTDIRSEIIPFVFDSARSATPSVIADFVTYEWCLPQHTDTNGVIEVVPMQ